jgi:GNAT superfamily N-acetyltransferase
VTDSPAPVEYRTGVAGLGPDDLTGFFVGWPDPPNPATLLALLRGSTHVVLAWHAGRVVGFVTALSDGVLMAYVPLLEVLPGYQGSGVGTGLVNRVLDEIGELYGVDVCCDDDVVPYYARFGFQRVNGMVLRPHLTPRRNPVG